LWANYPAFPEALGRNLSDRDWYKGISNSWGPYISSVFQLIVADKSLAVAVCVPILDNNKNVIGVLGNSQRLHFLETIFSRVYMNPKTSVTITDREGHILYSNKFEYTGKVTVYPLYSVVKKMIDKDINNHAKAEPEWENAEYLAVRNVDEINWTVIVERTMSDSIRAEAGNYLAINAILFLIFLCLALLIVYQDHLNQKNNRILRSELILKEVHHRIKNNMFVMVSMLSLQAHAQKNDVVKNILNDAAGRFQNMIVLYDKLYCTENENEISIKKFVSTLISDVIGVFYCPVPVRTNFSIDDFTISGKILSPLGIMINELVTNSIKYAFKDRESGLISVSLFKTENTVTLIYEDDGIGLPDSITTEKSSGFGMQLVGILIKQINGSIKIERNKGTRFVITFER
ncbi:MAG TPA: sensor histidine kinase, partial [Spirochaetota bacterium]